MEHWREILGIVASVSTGLYLLFLWLAFRRQQAVLDGDDHSLQRLIVDPAQNYLLRLRCIDKLRERDEDVQFAAPVIAQLALSDRKKQRFMVWFMTRDAFPELYTDPEYEYREPSHASRSHLARIAAHVEDVIPTSPPSAPPGDARSAL